MHRKTTIRREIKRLDQKHRRSAVKQALRGDHQASPPSWHTISWGRYELPLDMEPHAPRKKKRTKTVEYCPARKSEGKKRHYYIERTEERSYEIWWPTHHERKYVHRYKQCMYCHKTARASRKGGKHY